MPRAAQLTGQLASVVTCEAHNPAPLDGDGQRRAGQVCQSRQGNHSCIAGHLQKEGKGSWNPRTDFLSPCGTYSY